MHYEGEMLAAPKAKANAHAQQTHHKRRAPPVPQGAAAAARRVLPITFAEQHGSDAIPAKYSMEPHPLPVAAVSRKVAGLVNGPNGPDYPAADCPEYQVASSLRSSQSGRSSVSSVPSTTVTYLTKETTARGLFRKRKTVIDCGVINKFDNG